MNIAEAKQQIKDTVDAYLAQDETGAYLMSPQTQRPLFMLGAPGIGKTAIVSQVANELGIGLVSYSMTHHTRQSALGLPFIVKKDYDGVEFEVSEYTMSEIIASVFDYQEQTGHKRGILFLDEINCVSETLYPSMLQFLQFKTFGRHKVPDGWIVVCAGNPPEYNKSVYEFDVVTLDRLRKIEVQPDLDAWLSYARATGVHPAVVSYLEVKKDEFYVVETTPSGKAFVTARGWDDLSKIIKLFENQGKPVNRVLFEQYLQSDEVADRFAQCYALFCKYRADYQVLSILAGNAPDAIVERAKEARFDERLALVRLMLDALEGSFAAVLEEEQVTSRIRDILREAKPVITAGGNVADGLSPKAESLLAGAKERVSLEISTDAKERPVRLAAARLTSYLGSCNEERAVEGPGAFAVLNSRYGADTAAFRAQVDAASAQLDAAFSFVDSVYGDGNEMAVLVAELTARPASSQFINTFGSEKYYKYNNTVLVQSNRDDLLARIGGFDLEAAVKAQAAAERHGCGSNCGSGCGSC